MSEPYIGIDLGTTNSCVGLWVNGKVEILQNDDGLSTTPSVVCYKSSEDIIVGATAQNQSIAFAASTIYDAKRLIGKKIFR